MPTIKCFACKLHHQGFHLCPGVPQTPTRSSFEHVGLEERTERGRANLAVYWENRREQNRTRDLAIYDRWKTGETQASLARAYNLSKGQIQVIIKRQKKEQSHG